MAENEENNQEAATPAAEQPEGPQFALQRIYLKDSSFESPRTPAVFQTQWQPKINFDIKTKNSKLQDDVFEVVLVLTVEATLEEQPAFVVEVHQAGVFTARDFDSAQIEQLLATVCPNILFPYAREVIDALVVKGSFPALMLAPINFEALYTQQKQAAADANGAAPAPEATN
ncbi:MAG: protein-export chaperone SecB [Pseudohongiellaceae bacterium]